MDQAAWRLMLSIARRCRCLGVSASRNPDPGRAVPRAEGEVHDRSRLQLGERIPAEPLPGNQILERLSNPGSVLEAVG